MITPSIFLTGGSGLLGTELQKYLSCTAPSSDEFDILYPHQIDRHYDIVIHSAAYTNVALAEQEREECFKKNFVGTFNMTRMFPNSYFVYISSEYAKKPQNFYSYTKQWGEEVVNMRPNHLIIRTLFKPSPWPFEWAFSDQYTQGDYVDIIAPLIAKDILLHKTGTIYVGTGRKTMYELAKRTRPDVKPNSVKDIKGVVIPKDY